MPIHFLLLALAMGAIISIYVPMISQTAKILGSVPMANVPFFAIALISSVVITLSTGSRFADLSKISTIPPLLLTAGIMSACMILGTSFLVPRIGIGALFVLLVSGQVLASMIFGYLGMFGVPPSPLTLGKIAGAAMVIGGVWLVTFR